MYYTIALCILLLLAGIATANVIFLYLSLFVLLYVVLSLSLGGPSGITAQADAGQKAALDGERCELASLVTVEKGLGLVALSDGLPGHFQLGSGNNFHVYAKGFRRLEVPISYSVSCTRRGLYRIELARAETVHFSCLDQTRTAPGAGTLELVVRPKPVSVRKMQDPRVTSRMPMPLNARCRTGMTMTDFLEIRRYCPGDPFHSINWRATARAPQSPGSVPLVNDFEKEGRKTVWIFLDARASMKAGTTVENAFEYAVQAALGVSQFYLARDCRVGLSFYNCDEPVLPDTGRRQSYAIARRLIEVEITEGQERAGKPLTLTAAIESTRGHLAGTNPFFVIITMVDPRSGPDLIEGLRSMRKYSEQGKGGSRVMVLNILPHSLTVREDSELASATLAELRNANAVKAVRKSGASVVPWDPAARSLLEVMTHGLKRQKKGS